MQQITSDCYFLCTITSCAIDVLENMTSRRCSFQFLHLHGLCGFLDVQNSDLIFLTVFLQALCGTGTLLSGLIIDLVLSVELGN